MRFKLVRKYTQLTAKKEEDNSLKKRLLSLLLALALLCALVPGGVTALADAEETIHTGLCGPEGARYTVDTAAGTLTISGPGPMGDSSNAWKAYSKYITKVIVEEGITYIGKSAFSQMTEVVTISLPETVTSIGEQAFTRSTKLEACNIPSQVTTIPYMCFDGCTALKETGLHEGIVTVGRWAYHECPSLSSLTLPSSIRTVDNLAFYGCKGIETLTLNEGLETIGDNAFQGLGIQLLKIPSSVTSIGSSAFKECKSLRFVNMVGGGTELKDSTFRGCSALERIKLCDSLEAIRYDVFYGCSSLTRIDFPDSLAVIRTGVFSNCTSLRTVVVPNPDIELGFGGDGILGDKQNVKLYAPIPSDTFDFAYKFNYDLYPLDMTPPDDWDPENPMPEPPPSEEPTPTPEAPTPPPEEPTPPPEEPTPSSNPTPEPPPTQEPRPTPVVFTDVKEGAFYYDAVYWAIEYGITTGATATTFAPTNDCTRAAAVTFLWRAADEPEPTIANPFTDVPDGAYYSKAVRWALENGITNGISDTEFGTNSACTRGMIVTLLHRALDKPSASGSKNFTDVKSGQFYYDAVRWAAATGVTSGATETTFNPGGICTRGMIVTFMFRALEG